MNSIRTLRAGFTMATVLISGVLVGPAFAQRADYYLATNRQAEERMRTVYDQQVPPSDKLTLDYGGYLTQNTFHFDDGIQTRTLSRTELRLWASLSAEGGVHTVYARGFGGLAAWEKGTSPWPNGKNVDWEGPYLERLYYTLDLARAMDRYGGGRPTWLREANVTVGRQYVIMGTGLSLSMPMDAVWMVVNAADVRVSGLVGQSIQQIDDFDITRPGWDNSNRDFYGVQVEYTGLQKHTPFAYVLWSNDNSIESPWDPFQNYAYNANYFGVGCHGQVIGALMYSVEYVHQWGNSYGDGRFLGRDPINATAVDGQLSYTFEDVYGKPGWEVEYLYASGDPDRNSIYTKGGNKGSTSDNAYHGFGYRNTGLAFAPEITNLQCIRNSVGWTPFPNIEVFKDLRFGADFFIYCKANPQGAVSDPTANRDEGYLGWEVDNYFDWRITSDLSLTTRIGTFFPGSAFSEQQPRVFIFSGVTYSF